MAATKKYLIVGNWKMHLNVGQSSLLLHRLQEHIKVHHMIEVVLAPSLTALQPLSLQLDRRKFRLAAQNAYQKDEGAFTGEVSFTMLSDLVHYAIIGHSERRLYFNEDLDIVRDKVTAAIRNGVTPLICVGENQQEHNDGETKQVLHDQVVTALSNLTSEDIERVVIAYEPSWAISTFEGGIAKPSEVASALDYIKGQVESLYGKKAAKRVRLLYGGHVDDKIAGGYLELDDCQGVLVGAQSLNYQVFSNIIDVAYRLQHQDG